MYQLSIILFTPTDSLGGDSIFKNVFENETLIIFDKIVLF